MADDAALTAVFEDFARSVCEHDHYDAVDVLRQLSVAAGRVLPLEGAGVLLRQDGEARFVHATSTSVTDLDRLQERLGVGPGWEAMVTGRTVIEPDLASAGERWPGYDRHAAHLALRSVASLPLRARGEVWAVLNLYRSEPGTFSVEELRAARAVANLAASYLVLAADGDRARRAQEQLAHRATHDELTGLPNRALLLDRLEHCLATARRHGSAVAVLFIDLDRFKDVNDTHGHAVGDYLLVEVARRLTSVRRAEDMLSRLGGDEFVLVCADLPDSDPEAAAAVDAVSRRVRACLADAIPTRCGHIRVAASIGVALARPARDPGRSDPRGLLDAADTQMYAAKRRTGDAGLALAGPAG